ncbi:hypothetical protein MBANPS3_004615 [Mucor bainieri]
MKHHIGLGGGEIVFYDLTLPYGTLFSNILGNEEIDGFRDFRPCGSKAKFHEFKESRFSPRKRSFPLRPI